MLITAVGLLMSAAGCGTLTSLQGGDLLKGAKVVAGGFAINWKAPTAGTVYLIEKTSGKTIETQSVDEGGTYEFEMTLDDEEVLQTFANAFGVSVKEAELVLYFKPGLSQGKTR